MEKIQTGILDEKILALIAVGVAYGINCHPCLTTAVTIAKKIGVNEMEMKEATKVARKVKEGSTRKIEGLTEELLKGKSESEETCCSDAEEKCC